MDAWTRNSSLNECGLDIVQIFNVEEMKSTVNMRQSGVQYRL